MGKISEKRRSTVEGRLASATAKFGAQVMVSLEDEREALSIFVIRPDKAHRSFRANSRRTSIGLAEYAAKVFARPY